VNGGADPAVVADQAAMVAAAWSAPGSPGSWHLTAEQFRVLSEDRELLAVAATIPPHRLPPLLFQAAATFLVLELEPEPLRGWFPRVGEPQPPLGDSFRPVFRGFCLDHRDRLVELCAAHRYQMNEVGRCTDLIPALASAPADEREIALIDIGTGAGLALQADRYRYVYREAGGRVQVSGDPKSSVVLETEVRGLLTPPLPSAPIRIGERVGIDTEPLDLSDPAVTAWLGACIPQEIDAVTRFHHAVAVARGNPVRTVRGDAVETLPDVLAGVPKDMRICLLDSYVHVFLSDAELRRFREIVDIAGSRRDLDWISVDPLVPMGNSASDSVLGVSVPPELIERNRTEGVFGVIGRMSYRDGRRTAALLGIAHPGAAWLEWLQAPAGHQSAADAPAYP
jgi:hypothetical protein